MIDNKDYFEMMRNLKIEENKNLQNILDFCEAVQNEKNGVFFIKKMINTLIKINQNEININVQEIHNKKW